MAEPNTEKTPGPWELQRGIERIERAIAEQGKTYMTTLAWTLEKQILVSMIQANATELSEAKAESRRAEDRAAAAERYREDDKARKRLMWVTIIASPFVTAVVIWVLGGGLATPVATGG